MAARIKKYSSKNRYVPPSRPARKVNFRLIVLLLFCLLLFGAVLTRLFEVQVVKHEYYAEKARNNIDKRQPLSARRGTIYDRKGRELAKDVIQYSVGVRGRFIQDRKKLFAILSKTLNIPVNRIRQKVQKSPDFVYLARRVPANRITPLLSVSDQGLTLDKKFLRVYPYREMAAQIIGFCDVDNRPLGGIELQYNKFLQGTPGWHIYQRDAHGNQTLNLNYTGEDPIDGCDVYLTLDVDYQTILEDELVRTVKEHRATDGVAILMNPNSGELLGVANYPQFDPNNPNNYTDYQRKNRAVVDVVEPGSTFKIVLLSAALEQLHMNLDKDIVFCENGRYRLYGHTVLDHKKYGWLTLRQVVENSSNIGTMKVAERLDRAAFYRYVRNYGFGMISGVDLPAESPGIVHPLSKFTRTTHSFMSIGYEIGVTPLQLINAYSAVANGGSLYRPYLMRKVIGLSRRPLEENHPEMIREVISPETAALIKGVLRGVVEEGTGRKAAIQGIPVAGKTGTAQLYDPKTGRYDRRSHLASFVGFFPADHPAFVLLVMVRKPRGVYYGGLVAAPAFRRMAQRIMSLASVEEPQFAASNSLESDSLVDYIPRVEKLPVQTARRILEERGYTIRLVGNGRIVGKQEAVEKKDKIKQINLYLKEEEPGTRKRVPRLKGLTLREAVEVIAALGAEATVEGYGIVQNQQPRPGAPLMKNQKIRIICKPS